MSSQQHHFQTQQAKKAIRVEMLSEKLYDLQRKINEFLSCNEIETEDLIDIKYTVQTQPGEDDYGTTCDYFHNAMLIYRPTKASEENRRKKEEERRWWEEKEQKEQKEWEEQRRKERGEEARRKEREGAGQ